MRITDSGILRAEKFGSRDYDIRVLGRCSECGVVITNEFGEVCCDRDCNLFCSRECFCEYYGFEDAEGRI